MKKSIYPPELELRKESTSNKTAANKLCDKQNFFI